MIEVHQRSWPNYVAPLAVSWGKLEARGWIISPVWTYSTLLLLMTHCEVSIVESNSPSKSQTGLSLGLGGPEALGIFKRKSLLNTESRNMGSINSVHFFPRKRREHFCIHFMRPALLYQNQTRTTQENKTTDNISYKSESVDHSVMSSSLRPHGL